MLYPKPKGIKYTDMCIYIDTHVYEPKCDDDKIFEYIYHIGNALAHKQKFFESAQTYEDFSIYFATYVFLRLKDTRQFEIMEDGSPRLARVKSVLNYIKKTLYPKKVDFQKEYYAQILVDSEDTLSLESDVQYSFGDMLSESIDELSMIEFDMCLGNVIETTKQYLKQLPYYKDKSIWNNIYLSCLLSFLNSITLKRKDVNKLTNRLITNPEIIEQLYKEEDQNCVILYHLDDSMRDYIKVLTNEVKHVIAKDLSLSSHTYIPSDSGMRLLINQEFGRDISTEDEQ